MTTLIKKISFFFFLCLINIANIQVSNATEKNGLISAQCKPLEENSVAIEDIKHSNGILWKIDKEDKKTSYLYGTIHISDPEVTTLPNVVDKALRESDQFVMEALPDMEQMMAFSKSMFFLDGRLLSTFIDEPVYERTKQILSSYRLGAESISVLKPWAAFLIMNYPPDHGEPLDLVLLSIAQQNNIEVNGLESLKEQGEIFSDLDMKDQITLLRDTVCHYDVVEKDFKAMKAFYLKRDLGGLYKYVQRYSISDKPLYQKLMKKLIEDRNHIMFDRMQTMLDKGNAFIAIGAMHLAGKEGVLSLLEKQGYRVSAVY